MTWIGAVSTGLETFQLSHQQNQKVVVGGGKIMRRDGDLVLIGSPIMV